ncbi:MAG: ABC transporter substrate-binding protein [Acidimicrobiaceae bacterium]|nr:ABC transporter substrate-binding protein [Acidimicrobiaceae bacterium]
MRIVSFLPSTTEIVCDLGLSEQLLGVTIECNWPADVQAGREIVVATFTDPSMSPGEIDAVVRQRVAAGLDLYTLDDEALARCAPDLILSQDLCRVCAVASGDVEAAVARLNCSAEVIQIDPQTLDEVIDSIETIADAAGVTARGREFTATLRARLDVVAQRVAGRRRSNVFVLEWVDPPFGAGHWVPDIVARAGGRAVLARPGERSIGVTWQDIADAQPEVVIVAPCGYNLDQAERQARDVMAHLPSRAEVWAIDADAVMVRPGPRLIEGVEALAAVLHAVTAPPPHLVRRVR